MAKIIYETALLVCSACVIFTGTLSAVLLMLAWPNDRILGLSTRLVIGLCVIIVAIFSVGFVGTIAESTRALIIYACLLILFPVSILLVEIILRLSSLSPSTAPIAINGTDEQPSSATATPTSSPASSAPPLSSIPSGTLFKPHLPLSTTPLSTLIYSNSFTSNSISHSSLSGGVGSASPSVLAEAQANFSSQLHYHQQQQQQANSISASSSPALYALLPSPSLVPSYNTSQATKHNLSSEQQLLSGSKFANTKPALPTDFYLLFKDGYSEDSPPANHQSSNSKYFRTPSNFWSDIFTTSLSPRVETSVEYVLVGMLAFVLLQIVIAYLLASEIRTLRAELSMLASVQMHKSDSIDVGEATEASNLSHNPIQMTLCQLEQQPHSKADMVEMDFVELQPFNCYGQPMTSGQYYCDSGGGGYCMLTFEQSTPTVVQVHHNPDPLLSTSHQSANQAALMNDGVVANQQSQFSSSSVATVSPHHHHSSAIAVPSSASPPSSSSLSLTSKTNRRNRAGSFRVTFNDSAAEYYDSDLCRQNSGSGSVGADSEIQTPSSRTILEHNHPQHQPYQ